MYIALFFSLGDQLSRTPDPDDVAILSTMYPEPDFFATTGTITGTILAPNGRNKLTGVNVIARNVANPFFDAVSAISSDFTDDFSADCPLTGTYTINGLTPGESYALYTDEIELGGFSTPPLSPLLGPEDFYDGAESAFDPPDDPSVFAAVTVAAGSPVSGIDIVFNQPAPGTPLELGGDGAVRLWMPFTFTLCGQDFDSLWVNANGSLTFGAPDADATESAAEFLGGPPRAAGLWDDLDPTAGGAVSYSQTDNTFTVVYEDVPESSGSGANSFEITLRRAADHVDVAYGGLTAQDGLAGLSCGGAVTTGNELETALHTVPVMNTINMNGLTAAYELFDGLDNDLAHYRLRFVNLD